MYIFSFEKHGNGERLISHFKEDAQRMSAGKVDRHQSKRFQQVEFCPDFTFPLHCIHRKGRS